MNVRKGKEGDGKGKIGRGGGGGEEWRRENYDAVMEDDEREMRGSLNERK